MAGRFSGIVGRGAAAATAAHPKGVQMPSPIEVQEMVTRLEALESELGAEHVAVADQLASVGVAFQELGEYDEAGAYFERSLELRRRILGEDHGTVGQMYSHLGRNCFEQEDHPRAAQHYRRCLEIYEKRHLQIEIAEVLEAMARCHHDRDQYHTAESLLTRALAIRESYMAPGDPLIAESLNHLGWLYSQHGHFDKAEPLLLKALSVWHRHYGLDHAMTSLALENLGEMYEKMGRPMQASTLMAQVDQIRLGDKPQQ